MALSVHDRALGAILGSAVADAAAQPFDLLYVSEELADALAQDPDHPEFRDPSVNPYYTRQTGKQTCYGDQAWVLLQSLSECGGLDLEDLKNRTLELFGPGSEYDTPINDPYRDNNEPRPDLPIEGPRRHESIQNFMKNVDAGKKEMGCEIDLQVDGITRLAPIVAFYAGQPCMLEKVEAAIRLTQNRDDTVAQTLAAARFLEHFILNGPDPKALDAVIDQLTDPDRKHPLDLDKTVVGLLYEVKENLSKTPEEVMPDVFMNSGGLPGAFQAALHGVLTATEYEKAIRTTLCCGGCTSSRASFIGACLGAQVGIQGIPNSWKEKTLRYNFLIGHAFSFIEGTVIYRDK